MKSKMKRYLFYVAIVAVVAVGLVVLLRFFVKEETFKERRERMVKEQIAARGVRDERVLLAMRTVPRHKFVSEDLVNSAYDDSPLPIGCGQTISQPYIVALMTELLEVEEKEKVLEV